MDMFVGILPRLQTVSADGNADFSTKGTMAAAPAQMPSIFMSRLLEIQAAMFDQDELESDLVPVTITDPLLLEELEEDADLFIPELSFTETEAIVAWMQELSLLLKDVRENIEFLSEENVTPFLARVNPQYDSDMFTRSQGDAINDSGDTSLKQNELALFVRMQQYGLQLLQAVLHNVEQSYEKGETPAAAFQSNAQFGPVAESKEMSNPLSQAKPFIFNENLKHVDSNFGSRIRQQPFATLQQVITQMEHHFQELTSTKQINSPRAEELVREMTKLVQSLPAGQPTIHSGEPQLFAGNHAFLMNNFQDIAFTEPERPAAPETMHVSRFTEDMNQFILSKMRFTVQENHSEARIRLIPEHLGQLDIKISVQNGQLTALFQSENLQGKELLELQLPQLRQALQAHGLQVERLEVSYQSAAHSGNSEHSHHHFQEGSSQELSQSKHAKHQAYEMAEDEDDLEVSDYDRKKAALMAGRSFDVSA